MKLRYVGLVILCSVLAVPDSWAYVRRSGNATQKSSTTSSAPLLGGTRSYFNVKLTTASTALKDDYFDEEITGFSNYVGGAVSYGLQFGAFRGEVEAKITSGSTKEEVSYDYYYDPYYSSYINVTTTSTLSVYHQNLTLNAYYDMGITNTLSAFLTAGIGFERVAIDYKVEDDTGWDYTYDDDDFGFMAQLGLGASYKVSDKMALDLGYRYIYVPNVLEVDIYNHEFFLGGRFYF